MQAQMSLVTHPHPSAILGFSMFEGLTCAIDHNKGNRMTYLTMVLHFFFSLVYSVLLSCSLDVEKARYHAVGCIIETHKQEEMASNHRGSTAAHKHLKHIFLPMCLAMMLAH